MGKRRQPSISHIATHLFFQERGSIYSFMDGQNIGQVTIRVGQQTKQKQANSINTVNQLMNGPQATQVNGCFWWLQFILQFSQFYTCLIKVTNKQMTLIFILAKSRYRNKIGIIDLSCVSKLKHISYIFHYSTMTGQEPSIVKSTIINQEHIITQSYK